MRPTEVDIRRVVCDVCKTNAITARAGLSDVELNALAILLGWQVTNEPKHICPACVILRGPAARVPPGRRKRE